MLNAMNMSDKKQNIATAVAGVVMSLALVLSVAMPAVQALAI